MIASSAILEKFAKMVTVTYLVRMSALQLKQTVSAISAILYVLMAKFAMTDIRKGLIKKFTNLI